jgi:hypothetical protein
MILFRVDNCQVDPSVLWYHYRDKESTGHELEIIISESESEVIEAIESYCKCNIRSNEAEDRIIGLDVKRRSMGLIWRILDFQRGKNDSSTNLKFEWVVNKIIKFENINADFVIKAIVSKYGEI